MINADFADEQDRIKAILKQKAEFAKNTDREPNKGVAMYPAGGLMSQDQKGINDQLQPNDGPLRGAIVPQGFKHYAHCPCYAPDPRYPWPTMELAEIEMLSEAEARHELAKLCTLVRKQRILYRTKEMCMMQKY